MTNKNSILGKVIALALLPALALGMFAAPAMAFAFDSFGGVLTVIDVANVNTAGVVNAISVKADTGDNTANGGDGANGGDSGDSGDDAGEGGEAGDGGDGGDASSEGGSAYAESGYGALGGDGGNGGDTGNTGSGGNGGNGGLGGQIATGDAFASAAISNDINSNETIITIDDDCDCDRYNEYFESAHKYFERNRESWSTESTEGDGNNYSRFNNWNNNDESTYSEESSSDSLVKDSHWEIYTKTFVPVKTIVDVDNNNTGFVFNTGEVEAETGDNTANGGDGDDAGDSGDSGDDAGEGGEAGDGGAGGDADAVAWNNDDPAFAMDGGAGGDGGDGGTTGTTGNAGNGGHGAEGGLIVTGHADSILVPVINVLNRNVTRVVR